MKEKNGRGAHAFMEEFLNGLIKSMKERGR